jgi:hypothetical protein
VTYKFQADEETDAVLAALSDQNAPTAWYRREARSTKASKKPSAAIGAT